MLCFFDSIAQLVEQQTFNLWVVGSIPTRVIKKYIGLIIGVHIMLDYDLGLITKITGGFAFGKVIGSEEAFKIRLRSEAIEAISLYEVVAINTAHNDFIYS